MALIRSTRSTELWTPMELLSPVTHIPALVFGLLLYLSFRYFTRSRVSASHIILPPGPKGLPFVGNLFDVPSDRPWLTYHQWFKRYGDIIHVNVLGQPIILLGSAKRTLEVFEKKSTRYSDRPRNIMLPLMGWDFNFATLNYGSWWRRHRKCFHEFFSPSAMKAHHPIQIRETRLLLFRLLVSPDDFVHHIRHTLSAVIMDLAYGMRIHDTNDPYISVAEEAVKYLNQAGIAGSFLVDYIPALQHFPSWAPGTSFKRTAAQAKEVVTEMVEGPYNFVRQSLIEGNARPSMATTLSERLPKGGIHEEEETILKNVSAVAYAGGADTSSSAVQSFFLAMSLYPNVQKRAQLELDRVVGQHRLPDFSDHDSLIYIQAVVKEVLRWQPVAPLGVPHACTVDDEYDGYLIPAGSMVLGSSWSILHDPAMYPNPEEFKPERFLSDGGLNPNIRDPHVAAFGFGRRICPGRHLSETNLYIIVASVLSAFDIGPPDDPGGNPVPISQDVTSGLFTYPISFRCIIRPRSERSESLVHLASREFLDETHK